MRYLVISPCEDVRTGKEFGIDEEFLPEPEPRQAQRLIDAGCIEPMPEDAPILPGTNPADAKIVALEEDVVRLEKANAALRGKLAKAATDAGADVSTAKREIEQLTGERNDLRNQLETANSRVAELEKAATQEQAPPPADKADAKGTAKA